MAAANVQFTSERPSKVFMMKGEYCPEQGDPALDITELPALCMSNEVMELAQKLNKNPKDVSLAARIREGAFKDTRKAKKILGQAVIKALDLQTAYLYEEELEKFEDAEKGNILHFYEEIIEEDPLLNQSTDLDDPALAFVTDTLEDPAGDENPFSTEDLDMTAMTDDKTPRKDVPTTPKQYISTPQDKSSPEMLQVMQKLSDNIMAELRTKASQKDMNDLKKLMLDQQAKLIENEKKLDNIAKFVADVNNSLKEINRRFELRPPGPIPQLRVGGSTLAPGCAPVTDVKKAVGRRNLSTLYSLLYNNNIVEKGEDVTQLLELMLNSTTPLTVQQVGESLGFGFTDDEALRVTQEDFTKPDKTNEVYKILIAAKERGITYAQGQRIDNTGAGTSAAQNPPMQAAPAAIMKLFG